MDKKNKPLPFENERLTELYMDYKKKKRRSNEEGYEELREDIDIDDLLIQILELHPFVKVRRYSDNNDNSVIRRNKHIFKITTYTCDIWNFRKWLTKSSEGLPYKKIAGGVSDDGLYTLSALLRELLPRGLHKIDIYKNNNDEDEGSNGNNIVKTILFRGIPKFTGLISSDEDEESNSTSSENEANFFFNGKSIQDASYGWLTEKSNGENAKLSMTKIDDCLYLIAGSKNTCDIWEATIPYEDILDDDKGILSKEGEYPSPYICHIYSQFYLSLSEEEKHDFEIEFLNNFSTIMGEVNRSWSEHIIPIQGCFLEVFTLLDKETGKPINPLKAFQFLTKYGIANSTEKILRQVHNEKFDINHLEEQINKIRNSKNTEGAVLYLCCEDDDDNTDAASDDNVVIGLVKIKSNEYVVRRRIRENIKGGFLLPLVHGKIIGIPPIKKKCATGEWQSQTFDELRRNLRKRIENGMKKLTHAPGHQEQWKSWVIFATGFVDWLIEKYDLEEKGVMQQHPIPYEGFNVKFDVIGNLNRFWNDYTTKFGTLIHAYDNESTTTSSS